MSSYQSLALCRIRCISDANLVANKIISHYFAAPGPVKSFSHRDVRTTGVTLEWEQPEQTNGNIQEYLVTYTGTKQVCFVAVVKLV